MQEHFAHRSSNSQPLQDFWTLKAQNRLALDDVVRVCRSISEDLKDVRASSPQFVRGAIEVLCDIATMPDNRLRDLGQTAIFTSIVERLSDSFEPAHVPFYDRIFAQIIEYCRRQPGGEVLDGTLNRFGIHCEHDLIVRKNRAASNRSIASGRDVVKQAFVVSRVTLGADVAVTSVIVQCLAAVLPNAQITLIGPARIGELYNNIPRFRTLPLTYDRYGSLMDRLRNWIQLVRGIDAERHGCSPSEYIIVDPDSRLTQLGLLPLTQDEDRYFLFESRSYRKPQKERLGELTAEWCREVFQHEPGAYPFVRLSVEDAERGRRYCGWLRSHSPRGVVSFNFGVGENERKQLPLEFEIQLALQTLARGYAVVIDKGVGAEQDRATQVVDHLRAAGKKTFQLTASNADSLTVADLLADTKALTWQGSAGAFAGLIASADLYVGYDSAFQHIAAALGVPVIDIFTRADDDRFIDRWTPHSQSPVKVVKLTPSTPSYADAIDTVSDIVSWFAPLMKSKRCPPW